MGEPAGEIIPEYDDGQLFLANNLWRTLVDGRTHSVQTPNAEGRWDLEQRYYTFHELRFSCRYHAPTGQVVVSIAPLKGGTEMLLPLGQGKLGRHPISAELAATIEKLARSRPPLIF